MFPNLKHVEIIINSANIIYISFLQILRPAALRLESFRLDLMCYCFHSYHDLPSDVSLFEGLNFRHVKLCISDVVGGSLTPPTLLISWFSSLFRDLADSGTTVHFTELTFTFRYHPIDLEGALAEWATLDQVLSHAAFTGVRRIHFEDGSDLVWNARVTEKMLPELVSLIRRTLLCLSSRGVLSFL
ncbi:hypothetical protein CPB85DRAFT_281682 [Mucidula mucida]|nr:hypothetical protein CPB85DRAFT_281682 [Mucidula mucida]